MKLIRAGDFLHWIVRWILATHRGNAPAATLAFNRLVKLKRLNDAEDDHEAFIGRIRDRIRGDGGDVITVDEAAELQTLDDELAAATQDL